MQTIGVGSLTERITELPDRADVKTRRRARAVVTAAGPACAEVRP
jgi:hypothetical protein